MGTLEDDLREVVTRAAAALRDMAPEEAARPSAPGKWSTKEVVGHLVDSAWTNQQRFVRACIQDDLCFATYPQDTYVALQRYQEAAWDELVSLWELLNRNMARVVAELPVEARRRERARHDLDRIAWELVPKDEPVSLEYFLRDYLNHLQFHLHDVDPELAPPPRLQRR